MLKFLFRYLFRYEYFLDEKYEVGKDDIVRKVLGNFGFAPARYS